MLSIGTVRGHFRSQIGLGLVWPGSAVLATLTVVTLGVQAGQDDSSLVDAGLSSTRGGSELDAGSPGDRPVALPADLPIVDCSLGPDSGAHQLLLDGASPDEKAQAQLAAEMPVQPGPAISEPVATVPRAGQEERRPGFGHFGVGIDFGISGILPDAGLLLTVRPVRWGLLQLGAGYNGLAPAVRAGLTLRNPFVIPLTLTWEAGHYFEGDANRVVHWVDSSTKANASLERFGYDYMNLLGGLSVGDRDFAFYLRFGITWMRTTVHGFEQSVREATKLDVTASDPTIHYRGPALKVGFDYFL